MIGDSCSGLRGIGTFTVSGIYETRKKFVYAEAGLGANLATWTIHEDAVSYNPFSGVKQVV